MLTIHLHQLIFHAYHGLYEQENALGNEFEVNVDIDVDVPDELITRIHQTLNYATVYETIKTRMHIATPLLETVAQELVHDIKKMDERIRFVSINIKKLAAPIIGFQGMVGITYKKQF